MGSTTRRSPIEFKIPTSPDYKLQNIVQFKGIVKTDNPFNVNINSASDMLNLYVDESNTLTNRPRLEKEINLYLSVLSATDVLVTIIPLGSKKLIQYTDSYGVVKLKLILGTGSIQAIDLNSLTISSTKISAFEKGTNIYILDGIGFKVIKSDYKLYEVYNDTDTYVPTTYIGKTIDGTQVMVSYESKNKLSSKYKKLWYWDGEKSLATEFKNSVELSKNDYYKSYFETDEIYSGYSNWTIYQVSDNGKYLAKGGVDSDYNGKICILERVNGNFTVTDLTTKYTLTQTNGNNFALSRDGTKLLEVLSTTATKLYDLNYDNLVFDLELPLIETFTIALGYGNHYTVSNDGTRIWVMLESTLDYEVALFKYNDSTEEFDYYKTSWGDGSSNHNLFELFYDESNDRLLYYQPGNLDVLTYSTVINTDHHTLVSGNEYYTRKLSYDGSKIVCYGDGASSAILNDLSNLINEELSATTLDIPTIYGSTNQWNINQDASVIYTINDNNLYQIDVETELIYLIKELSEYSSFVPKSVSSSAYSIFGKKIKTLTSDYSVSSGITQYTISSEPLLEIIYDEPDSTAVSEIEELVEDKTINEANPYTLNLVSYATTPNSLKQIKILYQHQGQSQHSYTISDLSSNESITLGIGSAKLNVSYIANASINFTYISGVYSGSPVTYADIQLIVTYDSNSVVVTKRYKEFDNYVRFQNNYWYYGDHNTDYYTSNNDPTYLPEYNTNSYGDDTRITGYNILSDTVMVAYKENKMFLISYTSTWNYTNQSYDYYYTYTEVKGEVGNIPIGQCTVTCYSEYPVQIDNLGIYSLYQTKNVAISEHTTKQISEEINSIFITENTTNLITLNRLYWTLFIIPISSTLSHAYVLDNRTKQWFYWEFPVEIIGGWNSEDYMRLFSSNGKIYILKTTDIINEFNPDLTEYYDDEKSMISWKWVSQILPLGTINYLKQLISTGFIVTDTDSVDEYSLNYKFKVFRRQVNETDYTTIYDTLNYIQSVTKRTYIPRFNFLQLELSNVTNDLNNLNNELNSNKIRLIGLTFKYKLLEALI